MNKDCVIKENAINMFENLLQKISKDKVNLDNDDNINIGIINEFKEKFESLFNKYKNLFI